MLCMETYSSVSKHSHRLVRLLEILHLLFRELNMHSGLICLEDQTKYIVINKSETHIAGRDIDRFIM